MNLNTCAMITQKLCTTKNLFLLTQIRDVLSYSLTCWVVSFMRHKCYQFVCHLITLRIVEADAVIKTVTITSSSVTTTNFLSNEKCWQLRKTDRKDSPLRIGGGGGGSGEYFDMDLLSTSGIWPWVRIIRCPQSPLIPPPHPNPGVYFKNFQGGF